jgi:membrane protease YdiL (CAAX protease family)
VQAIIEPRDVTFEAEFLKKMFNRYWRDYPWFMQVIMLGLMIFTFTSFFLIAGNVLVKNISGYTIHDITGATTQSSYSLIRAGMLLQAISSIGVFIIPALCFAHLTHPDKMDYLGLRRPGKYIQLILGILIMLGALPLFVELAALIKHINLGAGINAMQDREEAMVKAYLTMKTPLQFILALVVLAIIPAIGEELLFRGVIFRLIYKRNNKLLLSACISALLFALLHGSPYNYPSIFIAGVLLSYLYYLTGSLWCNILAHMVYNGTQVWLEYIATDNLAIKKMSDSNQVPLALLLAGAVVFAGALYVLYKNRTPLPKTWVNDFTNEELEVIANSQNNNIEE